MTSLKKTLVAACAFSLLGLGAAVAQTDPNAAPAAPAAGGMSAPAAGDASMSGDTMAKKPMMKKHMSKKHMSKKMMKKKAM